MKAASLLATLVLAPVLVAGCTSSKTPEGSKVKYADGGTFTTVVVTDPGSLDPLVTSDLVANQFIGFTYDTLINLDSKGNVIPQLATSWQAGPDTVTFTLRKGVTCADGSTLTASQVAANFNFIKNPKNQSTALGYNLPDQNYTVQADDAAGTVQIKLAKPFGFLLTGAGTVPIVCAKGTKNRKMLAHGTDGTGPFTLVDSVASDHYTFAVRKGYGWGPNGASTDTPGFPAKVVFKVVQSDTTADNLFLNGQLNEVDVVGQDRERLLRHGYSLVKEPGSQIDAFFNERSTSPTSDPEVRKALSMGLDLNQVAQVLTEKNGKAPDDLEPNRPKPCTTPTVPGTLPAHDPTAAQAALTAAGWLPGADGVRAKDGTKLDIRLLYPGGTPSVDAGMELVASWWKSLGVHVTLTAKSPTAVQQVLFSTGGWDATVLNLGVNNPSQLTAYLSGPIPPDGQNFAAIKNPEYDQLSAQAVGTPGKAGCDLWGKAEKALFTRVDVLPVSISEVYSFGNKARFASGLLGLEPTSLRLLAG
ncbi:MAG TPA: ABC transporter substrate-binding protein [Jatrophihabitantaceae bacterium]|nr:ABC transporter substrate-binding protein [Jatrophihabitantaceae bacterium]